MAMTRDQQIEAAIAINHGHTFAGGRCTKCHQFELGYGATWCNEHPDDHYCGKVPPPHLQGVNASDADNT
jgi:hypothetical protein